MMSPKMQQAIQFLQLPLMELSQAIDQEIEKNPILEYETEEQEDSVEEKPEPETPEKEIDFDEHQFELLRHLDEDFRDHLAESGPYNPKPNSDDLKLRAYLESNLLSEPTLYEHLMAEAREAFSDLKDLEIAEVLIGYIDEHGFIKTPLSEIAECFSKKEKDVARVHAVLRTFDPIGIGSKNVQEALLSQLNNQNKQGSMAYKLIESHFEDLIHNRLPILQKKLKISFEALHEIIEELKKLEFHPLASFAHSDAPTLIPDIRLVANGETFSVEINDFNMKPLRINRQYLRLLDDETVPAETKAFIKEKLISAKWLMKNISARGETLTRIANFIGQYQKEFFASPEGTLTPLIMKSVAGELELHESTIARAVSNKFIDTPRGIFPFRHFFSKAYIDTEGNDVSSKTICQLIEELIKNEDKHKPLSDELLSAAIQKEGITCARRTVSKYRTQLKIGNTQQRRQY
jgi:RNA polymerase sigma-54 factor